MKSVSIILFILLVSLGFVGLVSAQTTSPTTVLPNESVTFTFDDTFLALTSTTNYTWNFGDNTTEVTTLVPYVSHIYTINGTYTLSVNVTAIPFAGSSWNVSSDWQQPLGVYSTSILVLTVTPTTDDGTMGIAVVALLMAIALPVTFFVIKQKGNSNRET